MCLLVVSFVIRVCGYVCRCLVLDAVCDVYVIVFSLDVCLWIRVLVYARV